MNRLQVISLLIILPLLLPMNAPLVSGYSDRSLNFQVHLIKNQKITVDSEPLVLLFNDTYHNLTEVYLELDNFEKKASHLINYSNIGYSYNNNSIPLVTLTDEQVSDEVKGKTYIVAHHHAREQITIEHTIRTIRDLVNNYNSGDESTIDLLSKFIIYFIVTLNPDSLDHVLYENECLRKTMRPYDEDGDGLFDEDGPDDVNNDGRISEFYEYYWNQSLEEWILLDQYSEGIDDDGDGLFNEDRIGGVDLNRNYPFHWNDSSADSGWGSDLSSKTYPGPEPASENETRALIDFVSKHNFTHAHSLHSGTNTTLFDWSYTNDINQPEAPMYRDMLIDFKARNLLPDSFFIEE
ncbi:MAG: M14 family zinc carboxypeptidase, partial [Candidatus Hodarchaeales archaeon]